MCSMMSLASAIQGSRMTNIRLQFHLGQDEINLPPSECLTLIMSRLNHSSERSKMIVEQALVGQIEIAGYQAPDGP